MSLSSRHVTLYHSPNTRSSGVLILLEELGADFTLQVLNMKAGEQRGADYLAINPMGKVPALRHGEALVTEQAALYIFLADLYPEAALAPGFSAVLRGPYLRWMVYYASCFEPAIVDRAQKRAPAPVGLSPYGDFDTMLSTVTDQLARGPYMLGEKFSAVDVLWGTALGWITQFGLIPATPLIQAYIDRINARPSVLKVRQQDAALVAAFD